MLRRRLPLERPWPWVLIGGISSALIVLLGLLVLGRVIADPWGAHLRGYTATGTLLGFVAVLLGTLTFVYSWRKRGGQERLASTGSMMAWLWLHVCLGVMAMVAALVHAGFGVLGLSWTSGKVLLLAFAVLTISGMVWRVLYRAVPPRAAARVGNYSEAASRERASAHQHEIDKLMAGASAAFVELAMRTASTPEVVVSSEALSPDERDALEQVRDLALRRDRNRRREAAQRRYSWIQQVWRLVHVPAALAVPVLLVIHVVGALRVPERVLARGTAPYQATAGFEDSRACRDCHRVIYDQWRHSMHAHAMNSPVTVVQNNQVVREELDDEDTPDPRLICINCHGPVGVALTELKQEILPLSREGYDDELLNEGISCVTCHQLEGEPAEGVAGLSGFQDNLRLPGDTYFGPLEDPVGNSFHQSASSPIWEDSEKLCRNCHNVVYDIDGDGEIVAGNDLILQRTTQEYDAYREAGGIGTCLGCHMPVVPNVDRSAERALLWFEQDGHAPDRTVHDHSFVGVDHPLDVPPDEDPQRAVREQFLASAATLSAKLTRGELTVTIENSGTGHNLPTGLAFARQMWLEVDARDADGARVFSSGRVNDVTDDLCDSRSLSQVHLTAHFRGCDGGIDDNLVNFQQQLVERIDNDDRKESVLQRLRGGVVARVRPVDGQKLDPIVPEASRTFVYKLPETAQAARVRLLFRSFAPYFLRTLAAGQPDGEKPRLAPLVKNLQIAEMARQDLTLASSL